MTHATNLIIGQYPDRPSHASMISENRRTNYFNSAHVLRAVNVSPPYFEVIVPLEAEAGEAKADVDGWLASHRMVHHSFMRDNDAKYDFFDLPGLHSVMQTQSEDYRGQREIVLRFDDWSDPGTKRVLMHKPNKNPQIGDVEIEPNELALKIAQDQDTLKKDFGGKTLRETYCRILAARMADAGLISNQAAELQIKLMHDVGTHEAKEILKEAIVKVREMDSPNLEQIIQGGKGR